MLTWRERTLAGITKGDGLTDNFFHAFLYSPGRTTAIICLRTCCHGWSSIRTILNNLPKCGQQHSWKRNKKVNSCCIKCYQKRSPTSWSVVTMYNLNISTQLPYAWVTLSALQRLRQSAHPFRLFHSSTSFTATSTTPSPITTYTKWERQPSLISFDYYTTSYATRTPHFVEFSYFVCHTPHCDLLLNFFDDIYLKPFSFRHPLWLSVNSRTRSET